MPEKRLDGGVEVTRQRDGITDRSWRPSALQVADSALGYATTVGECSL
jgi:hypothetical protein